jgi:hypothetical protein
MHFIASLIPGVNVKTYSSSPSNPTTWCIVRINDNGVGDYLTGHGLSDLTRLEAEKKAKKMNAPARSSVSGTSPQPPGSGLP